MTQYQAERYLTELGNGNLDAGIDAANAEIITAGIEITGDGIYKNHMPICHTAWRQVYGYQLAVVHHYMHGCQTLAR